MAKFDIQKIIGDVKSMISPTAIPDANKDDPVGYYLSELNKNVTELAKVSSMQNDLIAKTNLTLGALYQEIMNSRKGTASSTPATEKPTDTKKE